MMKTLFLSLALLVCLLPLRAEDTPAATPAAPAKGASPVKIAAENAQRLLTSLSEGNRDVFLENGSPKFQAAMTPQLFAEAKNKLGPILARPSQLDYLGSLRKAEDTVYLYRLRPDKGGDDSLVTLAMRGSTVVGFFVN